MESSAFQPNEFQVFCTELFVALSYKGLADGILCRGNTCKIGKGGKEYFFSLEDINGRSLEDFVEIVQRRFTGR